MEKYFNFDSLFSNIKEDIEICKTWYIPCSNIRVAFIEKDGSKAIIKARSLDELINKIKEFQCQHSSIIDTKWTTIEARYLRGTLGVSIKIRKDGEPVVIRTPRVPRQRW